MEKLILEAERYHRRALCLNTVGETRLVCVCDWLYNAGYRKADKVRGETANEILTYIGNMADECDDRFKLKNYHWFVKLCQKYGVTIDNNATH